MAEIKFFVPCVVVHLELLHTEGIWQCPHSSQRRIQLFRDRLLAVKLYTTYNFVFISVQSKRTRDSCCASQCSAVEVHSFLTNTRQMVQTVGSRKRQALKNVQTAFCWRPMWRPTVRWRILLWACDLFTALLVWKLMKMWGEILTLVKDCYLAILHSYFFCIVFLLTNFYLRKNSYCNFF